MSLRLTGGGGLYVNFHFVNPHGHGADSNVCTKYLGSVSLIIKLKRHIHLVICQTNYISDLAICFYYQIITVILTKTNVRQKVVRMLLNIIRLVLIIG